MFSLFTHMLKLSVNLEHLMLTLILEYDSSHLLDLWPFFKHMKHVAMNSKKVSLLSLSLLSLFIIFSDIMYP